MECRLPLFGWGYWTEAMAKLPACARREGSTRGAAPGQAPAGHRGWPLHGCCSPAQLRELVGEVTTAIC